MAYKNLPIPIKIGCHVIVDVRDGTRYESTMHGAEHALNEEMNMLQEKLTEEERHLCHQEVTQRKLRERFGDSATFIQIGGPESAIPGLGGRELTTKIMKMYYSDYADIDEDLDAAWAVEWIGPFYVMAGCTHIKNVLPAVEDFYDLVSKLEEEGHPLANLELLERAALYRKALFTMNNIKEHQKDIEKDG